MESLKVYQSDLQCIHGVLSITQIAADFFGHPKGQPASLPALSTELGLPLKRHEFRTAGNDSNYVLRVLLSLAARYQESLHCGELQASLVALLRQVAEAPLPPRKSKPKLECLVDLEPEEPLDQMPVDTSRFQIRLTMKEARLRVRGRRNGGRSQKRDSLIEEQAKQAVNNLLQDEASDDEEWTSRPGFE